MISLLFGLSYVAAAAAFVFVTLSLASGLLWLAEVIEENTKLAKIVGMRLTYAVILLHVALYFTDALPLNLVAFSIVCHVVYLQNFSATWPTISLTSLSFVASCVLVVADHFLWFFHFANKTQELRRRGGVNRPPFHHNTSLTQHHSFMEVASFFGVCIWLIPLFLFLSLSANDNALPTMGDASLPTTPSAATIDISQKSPRLPTFPRQSLFKTMFDPLFDLLAVLRLRKRRKSSEGIIAPPSPSRSPLPSPRPMTPTGLGLGFFGADGQTLSAPNDIFRAPPTRLKQPPPPRRVTTDSVSLAARAAQNSNEVRNGGSTVLSSPRLDGLRPRKTDSRPTTPIPGNGHYE